MASCNQIPHNHFWLLFFRIILKLYNTKIPNTFSGLLSVLSWCKPQLNLQFCHHFSFISNSTHTFSCFHIQNIDTFNENIRRRTCSVQADCCGDPGGLSQPAGRVEISGGFIQQSNLGLNSDYNITSMNKKSNFTLGYFQGCGQAGSDWLYFLFCCHCIT